MTLGLLKGIECVQRHLLDRQLLLLHGNRNRLPRLRHMENIAKMASMRLFFDLVIGLRERAVEKHFRSRATGSGLVDLPQHGIYIYAQGGEALVYPRGDRSGLFLNILANS